GRQHGTKYFLAGDCHIVAHTGEDRGFYEKSLAPIYGNPGPSSYEFRALVFARGDVAKHTLHLLLADKCAKLGFWIKRIGGLQLLRARNQFLHELVVDLTFDEKTRTGVTAFAFSVEDAIQGSFHRTVHVGVGKDDVRRFATEFERYTLYSVGGAAHDFFPDGGRSCKCDFVDGRMLHNRLTGCRSTGDDVEHAFRNACLDRELSEAQRRQWSLFRGLEYHRIATGQRRSEFPRRQ